MNGHRPESIISQRRRKGKLVLPYTMSELADSVCSTDVIGNGVRTNKYRQNFFKYFNDFSYCESKIAKM
jgi:hypothetical protein